MAEPTSLIKFDVCLYKGSNITQDDFLAWATKE